MENGRRDRNVNNRIAHPEHGGSTLPKACSRVFPGKRRVPGTNRGPKERRYAQDHGNTGWRMLPGRRCKGAAVTVRPILRFPHAGLKAPCAPVTVFDAELRTLAGDLLDTMRAAPGVGIAAAHIGDFRRVVVIELDRKDGVRTYINPEIVTFSEETMLHVEGSVSMPGATDEVVRPKAIRFRYADLEGIQHEETSEGFLAICIQHEIDQLDGIFWLQRISRLKRDRLVKKWERTGA